MVTDPYLVSKECNKFIDTLPRTQMESMDDNDMETTSSTASVVTSVGHPHTHTITSVSTFQTRQEANNPVQHWKNRCMKQDGLSAKKELLKTTKDKTRQMTEASIGEKFQATRAKVAPVK